MLPLRQRLPERDPEDAPRVADCAELAASPGDGHRGARDPGIFRVADGADQPASRVADYRQCRRDRDRSEEPQLRSDRVRARATLDRHIQRTGLDGSPRHRHPNGRRSARRKIDRRNQLDTAGDEGEDAALRALAGEDDLDLVGCRGVEIPVVDANRVWIPRVVAQGVSTEGARIHLA